MTARMIAAELAKPYNADILDDAVLGCLETSTVLDFMDGLDLEDTRDNRRLVARAIDHALREGF
jgi:hypothetical protein